MAIHIVWELVACLNSFSHGGETKYYSDDYVIDHADAEHMHTVGVVGPLSYGDKCYQVRVSGAQRGILADVHLS